MPFVATATIEPGSALLQAYRTPFQGVNLALPAHLLPPDSLRIAENVWLYKGALRARNGLAPFITTGLYSASGHAVGSFLYIDSAGMKHVVVATENEVFMLSLNGDSWNTISPAGYVASRQGPVRFASLENNGQVSLLMVVPGQGFYHKAEADAIFTVVGGIPEAAKLVDIAIAANRVVLAQPPYRILWSQFLNPLEYPANNIAIIAETTDIIIALRQLGTLGFVVYKEGSVYLSIAQNGLDSQAFRFEFYGRSEGPCGVNAIADINNMHFYMTPSGRISVFTGTQQAYIADGLWFFLQDDLDSAYANRVIVAWDYRLNTITFYYPRINGSGSVHGIIILNIPYPTSGINTYASFPGTTFLDIGAALSVEVYSIPSDSGAAQRPFVFAHNAVSNRHKPYRLNRDILTDDNEAYLCIAQPGLTPSPAALLHRPYIEIQALRSEDAGIINIYQVTSNLLETESGTIDDESMQLDLTQVSPTEYLGFTKSATFLSFRLEWLSLAKLVYYGADLYGRLSDQPEILTSPSRLESALLAVASQGQRRRR